MRRTALATAVLLIAAATGCTNSSDDSKPKPTVTVTKTPELSAEEARAACVDAWRVWLDEKSADYDPDTEPLPELDACEGQSGQTAMYAEALRERNADNRREVDECLEDPECTEWPVG